MSEETDVVTLIAVADVSPGSGAGPVSAEEQFEFVRPTLVGGAVTFAHLLEPISNRGTRQIFSGVGGSRGTDPDGTAALLSRSGFDVMSFASIHAMDRSEESLFDTMEACERHGVRLVGCGHTIEEARAPAVFERRGTKIGFLAVCSAIPKGYEATATRSGIAPLRAKTYYEQPDPQPGTPPRIVSICDAGDLRALTESIERLRAEVDVLVVSCNWGVPYRYKPASTIAMYQVEAAHAIIDAGADLIIGHHAQIIKGVESYRNKAIFYDLNHLILQSRDQRGRPLDETSPPNDSMKSLMVACTIRHGAIERVAVRPMWVDWKVQPVLLGREDPRAGEVFDYLSSTTAEAGLDTKFIREDDEFVVVA